MSKQTDLINIPDAITVSGSNVGIGTSSPAVPLEIIGTTTSGIKIKTNSAHSNGFNIYWDSSVDNAVLNNPFSGAMLFETANTERMRIDSSGNVLVGLTATEAVGTNAGTQLRADGLVYAAVTSDAHILSRRSSDGAILNFRKDTTTVGSIAANGGSIIVGSGDTGLYFDAASDRLIPVNPATASGRDNAVNLGGGSERFKDLYLSGGVYLGGTGSANKLDDYEEGTWTPNYEGSSTAGSVTYTARGGTYTKIGNQVTVYFSVINFSVTGASGGVNFTGLPFQGSFSNNVRGAYSGNVRMYNVDIDNDRPYVNIYVDTGSSTIKFLQWVDNGPWIAQPVENGGNQYIEGYLTYTTAS